MPIAQSTISLQLKKLATFGLVTGVKEGKWVVYHPKSHPLADKLLETLFAPLDAELKPLICLVDTVCRYQLCQEG